MGNYRHGVGAPFCWVWVSPLFLGRQHTIIFSNAQGINVAVPGFSQVFGLGKGGDTQIQDRWWFWLIIGLIAALLIVLGFFSWRGVRRWKRYIKKKLAAQDGGDPLSAPDSTQKSIDTSKSQNLGPGSVQNGERVEAHQLSTMEEGREIKTRNVQVEKLEEDLSQSLSKSSGSSRVTVERQDKESSPSWAPKYGVNWKEVERRAGTTPQQKSRHHHRRISTSTSAELV